MNTTISNTAPMYNGGDLPKDDIFIDIYSYFQRR